MMFVTVGSQMPFDRLVKAVDRWAGETRREDVFAQIGPTDFRPSRVQWTKFLDPTEFAYRLKSAKVVIAHAGTGSLIAALQAGKPIIVMPRRASLGETRNDHQVATAEQFRRFDSVRVALDEVELEARLSGIDGLVGHPTIGPYASRELLAAVRGFIGCVDAKASP